MGSISMRKAPLGSWKCHQYDESCMLNFHQKLVLGSRPSNDCPHAPCRNTHYLPPIHRASALPAQPPSSLTGAMRRGFLYGLLPALTFRDVVRTLLTFTVGMPSKCWRGSHGSTMRRPLMISTSTDVNTGYACRLRSRIQADMQRHSHLDIENCLVNIRQCLIIRDTYTCRLLSLLSLTSQLLTDASSLTCWSRRIPAFLSAALRPT